MLLFKEEEHKKFIEYFNIKKEPWDYEKALLKKVKLYIPFLVLFPWILFVGIGNSLSMNTCHKDSDIDLFIITKQKRLWFVRFFVTLYFFLLWQRKTEKKHAWKFCLSFFITEESMNFEKISLEKDIYLFFRILHMKPLIDINDSYEKFILENKKWCNFDTFAEIIENNKNYILIKKDKKNKNWIFWNLIEKIIKKIWFPKTLRSSQRLWSPFWLIIDENMLKFHNDDKRKIIKDSIIN